MRYRKPLFSVLGFVVLLAAIALMDWLYWRPHLLLKEGSTLPVLPSSLTTDRIGIFNSRDFCPDIQPTFDTNALQQETNTLRTELIEHPNDLCVGNRFRQGIRMLTILRNQFAISVGSLPPELASLVKPDQGSGNSLPLTEDDTPTNSSDASEPVATFAPLDKKTSSSETALQLGLSYVDLMIREGGREQKAKLSSHSIESLTAAIKINPYSIGALYGRGLNYLYWPTLAGKLPFAVRDLKTCIALSRLPGLQLPLPKIVSASYLALGDVYVKLADSSLSATEKRAFLGLARQWWQVGLQSFPNDASIEERLSLSDQDLVRHVNEARGLETYINDDLNLLWRR